ncbi:PhzF family phenazine biosynthesis protein [Halobellus limi]|uniref:Phenazine biosynthesis protein PhzF family n=1 Tax=Halobellus limi TaxID=699433 RepID=A0A1H6C2P6_9EURY|nr:PhzF family phenazine biosynthesis protein [Halobellus limi]QCC48571.1 PhzF family phenazine biosynthesis protein [Halobellus limi]SEG67280.1 phenazine biosynthesis protein PhzF family [Halobellus limi]
MDTRRALLVDAFAAEPLAGNVAGVVPDASGLADEQMRAIARELGASETAFVRPSDSADRRLRFFSPTQEVDLCGHATVAAHAHLHEDGVVDPGEHTVETNVGDLAIEIEADGTVWMTQNHPRVERVDVDYDRLGSALGIDPAALRDVGADAPTAVASTGLPFLIVPVNFLQNLGAADPDLGAVEAIADEHDAAGVYAFTFDALDADSTLHARAFAPSLGIAEDPATGTASGACGAYLREIGAFDEFPDEMRFEQGHFLDRPGAVRVRVAGDVRVGGSAVTSLDGRLAVPAEEEDGIVEA